jgi:formate hydrogenlyase subunit 3/multisubunit Na+/H+ antiporter MnhD subunit
MSLITRALIAVFAGIGAGTVGFWAVWKIISGLVHRDPAIGNDLWLLVGIFAPGIAVALVVYHVVSKERPAEVAAT